MKHFSLITLLIFIAASTACGAERRTTNVSPSKKTVTKTMTLNPFDELEVNSAINVKYIATNNNSHSVEISAPENLIGHISVTQHRNEITLSLKRNVSVQGDLNIDITVKAPSLKEVKLNGASTFSASEIRMPGRKFELDMNGATSAKIAKITAATSEIELNGASNAKISNLESSSVETDISGSSKLSISGINAARLEVEASGASIAEISGKATNVEYSASGASFIKAKNLKAVNGEIEASGTANINANIKNIFKQRTSGTATISNNR